VLLADELFCIAHDDRTGRARLHPRVLGLGLGAGLLGELLLFDRITIYDGGVFVLRRDPPPDAVAHATLEHLVAQPQHRDVRTWLAFLAETAVESVAHRLVLAGVWRREEHRRLVGRARYSHMPVDPNAVVWRSVRLARLLASEDFIGLSDVLLAGLVSATGLVDTVLWQPESHTAGLVRLNVEVGRLDWPLYHLLAFTNAAAGDAVLTPR
jgi:hypothetical protein